MTITISCTQNNLLNSLSKQNYSLLCISTKRYLTTKRTLHTDPFLKMVWSKPILQYVIHKDINYPQLPFTNNPNLLDCLLLIIRRDNERHTNTLHLSIQFLGLAENWMSFSQNFLAKKRSVSNRSGSGKCFQFL